METVPWVEMQLYKIIVWYENNRFNLVKSNTYTCQSKLSLKNKKLKNVLDYTLKLNKLSQYFSKSDLFNLFKKDFFVKASVNIDKFLSSLSVLAPSILNELDPCVFVLVDSICSFPEDAALV